MGPSDNNLLILLQEGKLTRSIIAVDQLKREQIDPQKAIDIINEETGYAFEMKDLIALLEVLQHEDTQLTDFELQNITGAGANAEEAKYWFRKRQPIRKPIRHLK